MTVLEFMRTTRGRIVMAFLTSVVIAALWLAFDMPLAIIVAVLVPVWIPIFKQQEPVSPDARRWQRSTVMVGALILVGLMGLVIFLAQR